MNERLILRGLLVLLLAFAFLHTCAGHARASSTARVEAVHRAIDAATTNPEWRAELRRVCQRESWCNKFGVTRVHEVDASLGESRWRRARERGMVNPDRCHHHELGDGRRWSTRGAFGMSAAYVVRFVAECASPSTLDDPRLAARAAVGWMRKLCTKYGACTCRDRARWWAGPGVWDLRSPVKQLAAEQRQCGAQPWWRWVWAATETTMRVWRSFSERFVRAARQEISASTAT